MPLLETKGAASAQGFGLTLGGAERVFIEDVFSTFPYTGNGSTQTITNGIDLSTKGGLVWSKCRSSTLGGNGIHTLIDTVRGVGNRISSELTDAQVFNNNTITAFNNNGFSIGNSPINNTNAETFVSWTFRKQPKFCDVVTWAGNQVDGRVISHNLNASPGAIIVKAYSGTNATDNWWMWHRYFASAFPTESGAVYLNDTSGYVTRNVLSPNNTAVTNNTFTVTQQTNYTGTTYVAYLFAHDAGGFGLSGTDNVISCGSYTGTGASLSVSLGYEPQWILLKDTSATGNWRIFDNMRGWPAPSGQSAYALFPNLSNAETDNGDLVYPTATGFQLSTNGTYNTSGRTYIYIAIRRGPMRVPTSGTSVFGLSANSNNIDASTSVVMTPEASDLWFNTQRAGTTGKYWLPRLTGWAYLSSASSGVEDTSYTWTQRTQTDLRPNTGWWTGNPSQINYFFRRAPGFFDVVCYTGDGVNNRQLSHNLGVVPELVIHKSRNTGTIWYAWATGVSPTNKCVILNSNLAWASGYDTGFQSSTAAQLNLSTNSGEINISSQTYAAYLFASCPGVSKVGSYTGTGSTLQINCGFTGGARFVLIKRTDSTGDWYVWDTARGIVAGNDPYLLLNSTAAEVTTTDWVDTLSTGFELSNVGGNNVNINTATYIYLAIA